MKWLFSAHKITQHFLNSQRYHLHGGSRWPSLSVYFGHYYSTSKILNDTESSHRLANSNKTENNIKDVDLEIVSTETIKPFSPTPHHLRTFNLSIIDQCMYDVYSPWILFFPNTNKESVTDVVAKRSKRLKESLSKILTRFYPLAGKLKDNLQIVCNDEGIYYTEARVNQTLQDFLRHPDDEKVKGLMPKTPGITESSIGNYAMGIQVNIFKCGGIGLSTNTSHKIVDAHTYYLFMKAWAAAFRGSQEYVSPSFVASEIFPNNPLLEYSVSSRLLTTKSLSTKRFVFDSTTLSILKAQPVASTSSRHPPTRVEATTAVIWKAAAKAASKVKKIGPQSPHALFSAVNLRQRASPPLSKESIGNLIDVVCAICFPGGHLDLPTMMGDLREAITKINADHIESKKGIEGRETFNEILGRLNQLMDATDEGDRLVATSFLNSGMYELDFGWGKPIWFYVMNARVARKVALNDTLKGSGVEAIVTLSPDEMEIFEHDSELLSYATVNPSPLRFVL